MGGTYTYVYVETIETWLAMTNVFKRKNVVPQEAQTGV